jgi:hypothetical protein
MILCPVLLEFRIFCDGPAVEEDILQRGGLIPAGWP